MEKQKVMLVPNKLESSKPTLHCPTGSDYSLPMSNVPIELEADNLYATAAYECVKSAPKSASKSPQKKKSPLLKKDRGKHPLPKTNYVDAVDDLENHEYMEYDDSHKHSIKAKPVVPKRPSTAKVAEQIVNMNLETSSEYTDPTYILSRQEAVSEGDQYCEVKR